MILKEIKRWRLIHLEDTAALASEVTVLFSGSQTVGLVGTLGSGKTTFTRELVKALGGNSSEVASPSFALQYEYKLPNSLSSIELLEHWDLYRLKGIPEELYEPVSPNTLRVIEWPDKVCDLDSENPLRLNYCIKFSVSECETESLLRIATLHLVVI